MVHLWAMINVFGNILIARTFLFFISLPHKESCQRRVMMTITEKAFSIAWRFATQSSQIATQF